MNDHTNDQVVDFILQALFKYDQKDVHISPLCNHFDLDEFAFMEFVERLIDDDLALRCDTPDTLRISPFGRHVSKNGGWLKHISDNDRISEMKSEIDRLTVENLKLQNRQLRRFIIYSIIAYIFGIVSLATVNYVSDIKNEEVSGHTPHEETDNYDQSEQPIDTLN